MNTNEMAEQALTPLFEAILDVAASGADMQRLLHLDRAWTAADDRRDLTDVGRQRLSFLGEVIDLELARVERHSVMLQGFFETYGPWVDGRIEHELAEATFSDDQRAGILRFLGSREGGYASRGRQAAGFLADNAGRERTELRGKIRDLREGQTPVTDMSHEMFCNLAAGGIIADLAVCPETLGVGCAAALAVYLIADSQGC